MTAVIAQPATWTVTFPAQSTALTVDAASVADLVAAILAHVRQCRFSDVRRPVWAAIDADGRAGHLWNGQRVVGTFRLSRGGAR